MKRDTKLIAILSDQDDFAMLVLENIFRIGPLYCAAPDSTGFSPNWPAILTS